MGYRYKKTQDIAETMDLSKGPFIGTALCDMVQGDPGRFIPDDIGTYHIPLFYESMGFMGIRVPFFAELQPETPWILPGGSVNGKNAWERLEVLPEGARTGMHLPVSHARLGSVSGQDMSDLIENRKRCIEMGERLGVRYYVLHISRDGYLRDENYPHVKEALRRTLECLASKNTRAYVLLENLEYPQYPATPQELLWWYCNMNEIISGTGLKSGIMLDISHLWKTRGNIIRSMRQGKGMPDWIMREKDIIHQSFHDLLSYTLKQKLEGIAVPGFHLSGCYGEETHLIPGMTPNKSPESAVEINRPYDENIELNIKTSLKIIMKYYMDGCVDTAGGQEVICPMYVATESFVSYKDNARHVPTYGRALSGARAIRDFSLQYLKKLYDKAFNRVTAFDLLSSARSVRPGRTDPS